MATTTSRTLDSIQSIQYIRSKTIVAEVTGMRPNTRIYPFFDGIAIDEFCAPTTSTSSVPSSTVNVNQPIITDNNGSASFTFFIPPLKFNTGDKLLMVAETNDTSLFDIPGNTFAYAIATYATKGTKETYKLITTNTIEVVTYGSSQPSNDTLQSLPPEKKTGTCYQVVRPGATDQSDTYYADPLAQSFFTHGVKGGIFVTAIELFFQTKDPSIPVQVDIREMSMGYPKLSKWDNPDLISVVQPDQVATHTVAQLATNPTGTMFNFNPPVYLKEDGDYCFVVHSNSNKYHLYTSKMGENSIENGKLISTNPFIGSMFKSENNATWTAEQTEDIKFNIYKAKFSTSQGTVKLAARQVNLSVSGTNLYVQAKASPTTIPIIYKGKARHGLVVGDKIGVGSDSNAVYNGIPGASFTGDFPVTAIIDDFTVEFTITVDSGVTPTLGQILSSGIIRGVSIPNGGSGYNSAPTLTITPAPSSGTNSTATAVLTNGKITNVIITQGTGKFSSAPNIVVDNSGTGGSGASLIADISAQFSIAPNIAYSVLSPQISQCVVGSSAITGSMKNLNSNSYTTAIRNFNPFVVNDLSGMYRLANRFNENIRLSNQPSLTFDLNMITDNPNVSPVIDLRTPPKVILANLKLNNQHTNEFVKTNSSVSRAFVVSGGTGYSVSPTVVVSNAPTDTTGSGAAFTVTVSGGVITGINITNIGSGYTLNPTLTITDSTGSGAKVYCELEHTAQNGSIKRIDISSGGSGYTVAPTVTITSANNDLTGAGATATAVLGSGGTSGQVVGVTINSQGSGYTQVPTITFSAPTSGTTATGQAILTNFNSESGGVGNPTGSAYTRYLTRKISLASISSGVRVIAHIDSSPETSVDVYIRTSLSGSNSKHTDNQWMLLECNSERNRSSIRGQFYEYTFFNENLPQFDVYDLKFVLSSSNPARTPAVKNYRVIIAA